MNKDKLNFLEQIKNRCVEIINTSKKYKTNISDLNEWVRGFIMGAECMLGINLDNKYTTGTFETLVNDILKEVE